MAADKSDLPLRLGVMVFTLWGTNFISAKMVDWPFAYCIGAPLLQPMAEIYQMFFWVTLIIFAFTLISQKWSAAFAAAIVVFLTAGLPSFADVAFRLGRSCS